MVHWSQKHLRDVNETYVQHAVQALRISAMLACGAVAACVHAFLPFLYVTTASKCAAEVLRIVQTRGSRPNAAN
jgi:hypothetical protein